MASSLLLVVALLAAPQGQTPWYVAYEHGVELVEKGDGVAAMEEFEKALREQPKPGLHIRTYGLRYVDYLPHLYMAMAAYLAGDSIRAEAELTKAERIGAAARSEAGLPLLEAYRVLLREPAPEVPSKGSGPPLVASHYRRYPNRPTVLTEQEFQTIRQRILTRCGLQRETEDSRAPWYFHYEMGMTLEKKGDPQRALGSLIAATDRRPYPQRDARMYGMWFTDYRPYFEIARAHARLGNWRCALDAIQLSRRFGEVKETDSDYASYRDLISQTKAQQGP